MTGVLGTCNTCAKTWHEKSRSEARAIGSKRHRVSHVAHRVMRHRRDKLLKDPVRRLLGKVNIRIDRGSSTAGHVGAL
jgi:hypothetical protein